MDQVAEVTLGGMLRGGKLCAQLRVAVVEDELVVAGAAQRGTHAPGRRAMLAAMVVASLRNSFSVIGCLA